MTFIGVMALPSRWTETQLLCIPFALGIHVEDILGLESLDGGAEFDKRWKDPSDETITVIHTKDPQTAITAALDQLNEEGQQKAVERVTELTEIKRYKK